MHTTSKLLAVWLIVGLGLPSPALALRAVGLEESNQRTALVRALGVDAHGEEDPIAETARVLQPLIGNIPVELSETMCENIVGMLHDRAGVPDVGIARALAAKVASESEYQPSCWRIAQRAGLPVRAWYLFFHDEHPVSTWQFHPWMDRSVVVNNPRGIHNRPSVVIQQTALSAIHYLGVEIELMNPTTSQWESVNHPVEIMEMAIAHNTRVILRARGGVGREAITAAVLSNMRRLLQDREALEEGYSRYAVDAIQTIVRADGRPSDPLDELIREFLIGNWRLAEALGQRAHERYHDVIVSAMSEWKALHDVLSQPVVQQQITAWETEAVSDESLLAEIGAAPEAVPIDEMVEAARRIMAATAETSPVLVPAIHQLWLLLRREEIRGRCSESERGQRRRLVELLGAGLEEDPIAAALKDMGVAAVDVAADGTARLNGQVIAIPPALKQPGFFGPGSRTIVVRTTPHEISPDTVVLDQIRIEGAPGTLGILPAQYVDLVRNGITTAQALAREIAGWVRKGKPIVAVVRASRVPIEEAHRMARTQSPAISLIGVPDDYPVVPGTIAGLGRAAQAQGGLLYLSASYATIYRNDRVLLIAA